MNLTDLDPSFIEFPENQVWYRIQRARARFDSVRLRGFIMAPAGALTERFDLEDEATAHLADGELTALYESLFRLEARSCHLDRLKERTLTSFRSIARLRLADLRGLEEKFSSPGASCEAAVPRCDCSEAWAGARARPGAVPELNSAEDRT